MLGWFGFKFTRGGDVRNQGGVNIKRILTATIAAELSDRFNKRQRFNVANRSPNFNNDNVRG